MQMQFKAPCTLHLYQDWWQKQGEVVSAWHSMNPGSLAHMGELAIKKLAGKHEVLLGVRVRGAEHFVLVKEIDTGLRELCGFCHDTLESGVAGAESVWLEKMRQLLHTHQRAALTVVGH